MREAGTWSDANDGVRILQPSFSWGTSICDRIFLIALYGGVIPPPSTSYDASSTFISTRVPRFLRALFRTGWKIVIYECGSAESSFSTGDTLSAPPQIFPLKQLISDMSSAVSMLRAVGIIAGAVVSTTPATAAPSPTMILDLCTLCNGGLLPSTATLSHAVRYDPGSILRDLASISRSSSEVPDSISALPTVSISPPLAPLAVCVCGPADGAPTSGARDALLAVALCASFVSTTTILDRPAAAAAAALAVHKAAAAAAPPAPAHGAFPPYPHTAAGAQRVLGVHTDDSLAAVLVPPSLRPLAGGAFDIGASPLPLPPRCRAPVVLLVTGPPRCGKSSLVARYVAAGLDGVATAPGIDTAALAAAVGAACARAWVRYARHVRGTGGGPGAPRVAGGLAGADALAPPQQLCCIQVANVATRRLAARVHAASAAPAGAAGGAGGAPPLRRGRDDEDDTRAAATAPARRSERGPVFGVAVEVHGHDGAAAAAAAAAAVCVLRRCDGATPVGGAVGVLHTVDHGGTGRGTATRDEASAATAAATAMAWCVAASTVAAALPADVAKVLASVAAARARGGGGEDGGGARVVRRLAQDTEVEELLVVPLPVWAVVVAAPLRLIKAVAARDAGRWAGAGVATAACPFAPLEAALVRASHMAAGGAQPPPARRVPLRSGGGGALSLRGAGGDARTAASTADACETTDAVASLYAARVPACAVWVRVLHYVLQVPALRVGPWEAASLSAACDF